MLSSEILSSMGPTMSKDLRPPAALAMAFGAVDTGSMKERLAFDYLGQGDDSDEKDDCEDDKVSP